MSGLPYRHVDVFAHQPFSGNGLAVFPDAEGLSAKLMLRLTQELRQFESIFLAATAETGVFDARVFTVEEELPFAGHPALGAGAVVHEMQAPGVDVATFVLALPAGRVRLDSERVGPGAYRVAMEQGRPTFGRMLREDEEAPFLDALSLEPENRDGRLPLEVVSTGLPYLIVPVTPRARDAGWSRPRPDPRGELRWSARKNWSEIRLRFRRRRTRGSDLGQHRGSRGHSHGERGRADQRVSRPASDCRR